MRPRLALAALFSLILVPRPTLADDFDSLMNRRIYSQAEINLNFAEQLARLVEEDKPDSVRVVLEGWKSRSDGHFLVQRFDSLWRMGRNEFFSHEIDEAFLENLLRDRQWRRYWSSLEDDAGRSLARPEYGYPQRFERVTLELATGLAKRLPANGDARLVATAYTGDYATFFHRVKGPEGEGTALRDTYDARVRAIHDASEGYLNFSLGWAEHGGGASELGGRPSFFFGARGVGTHWSSGLHLGMQPADLREEVELDFGDPPVRTKNAIVLEALVDVGRHLRKGIRSTTTVLVGAGLSDLRIFHGDDDPPDAEDLVSFVWSAGLLHRYRWSEYSSHSIEILLRYSLVDYDGAGVNYDGNVWSIQVGWAGSWHFDKYRELGRLN